MLDDLISRLERRLPEGVRRQYLAKFAVSVAVVAVVTLLASAFLFSAVQADIKGNTQESLQIAAEDDAEDIASWIDEYEQQAHVMSMYQEMQVNDGDAITSTLEVERNQMSEETHSLHYFDAETGEIEYSSGADMTGTTLSDLGLEFHVLERESVNADADIEEVSADSFEVSQVDTSFSDVISYEGSNVIGVVSPVRGKDKGVLILIEVSTRAGAFTEQVDGQNTRTVDLSDGTVGIDEAGNATGTTYRNGEDGPVIGTLRETETSGATDRDDTNEVVGYAPIEGTDWAVVTHAPQSSAYAVANTVRNGFIAVIGVVLLGFVAIGATIGRTTARSLDQLAEQAQALARGETDLEIGSDGRVDELGRVQDSVAETQAYIDTAAEQSGAIADHRFDDPALEREVPGQLGDSLEAMSEDLESFIRELEEIASGEFGTTMQRAASGDLTQRIDPDAGNEALREIAVSFNGMMDDIERTVASISDLAADVDSVSNEIASNAGQIEEASTDVTDSIDDVSESAAEQKDRFDAVHNEMDAISATIEEIASSSTQVAGVTTDAAERAEATRDDAADVLEEMARIEERTDDVTERIRELGSEMEQIDEIVALIDEIAEQTSILALNANIEAARASGEGDASEGFGVVADEVKDLASETADATQEADSLISELQESTEAVVDDVGKVQNSVESGVKAVEESIEALDDIVDRVEEAEQGVQSINQATDEQATSTEDVARMVDEVIEISEETDAEADNVASAAREQTASIARISDGTEELTDRSQALRTELETFEWNDGGEHTTGPGSDHGGDASRPVDSGSFERETEPRDATDTETDESGGSVASDD
jgi:methyl-accepting chemotaxis protein